MSFSEIWQRIVSETDLTKLTQLADLVGTTQQYVSRKKKKDEFPVEWAYKVGEKYKLLTEWIMKGDGPVRLSICEKCFNQDYLKDVDRWLSDLISKEPNRKEWFECAFEDSFPMFKEWRRIQSK
jgi:hypothetical protein